MDRVIFYEKPGCANNARQKALLAQSGREVVARNLLLENWTDARLRSFFKNRPVSEWFNRASPRVKSGEVIPDSIDADTAIALMLNDPLLIRRPLIEADGRKESGFDPDAIGPWLGVKFAAGAPHPPLCANPRRDQPCPAPQDG